MKNHVKPLSYSPNEFIKEDPSDLRLSTDVNNSEYEWLSTSPTNYDNRKSFIGESFSYNK